MSKPLTGRAYAFINCRSPKEDVRFFANDIKRFMSEDLKAQGYGPVLDHLRLGINQGLTCLKKRGMRRFEARAELLKTVMEAEEEGKLFTKPGPARILTHAVFHAAVTDTETDETVSATFLGHLGFEHDHGSLYIIHAALAKAPNLQVADELAAIVNNMYCATPLYQEGEPFRGIITYLDRDQGRYVLRE